MRGIVELSTRQEKAEVVENRRKKWTQVQAEIRIEGLENQRAQGFIEAYNSWLRGSLSESRISSVYKRPPR